MVTKAQIKHIQSLVDKKYRSTCHSFVAETPKICQEILQSDLEVKQIFATDEWIENHEHLLEKKNPNLIPVSTGELKKLSTLQAPNQVVCEITIPQPKKLKTKNAQVLLLDGIQDPGNLGTIIRIADWFGIPQIVCDEHTCDVYNSKVVQSSMASILRVAVHYIDLVTYLNESNIPLYASTLNGTNLKQMASTSSCIIAIGNEGRGLSKEITDRAKHKITIAGKGQAESLNAAVACGIICSHLLA